MVRSFDFLGQSRQRVPPHRSGCMAGEVRNGGASAAAVLGQRNAPECQGRCVPRRFNPLLRVFTSFSWYCVVSGPGRGAVGV